MPVQHRRLAALALAGALAGLGPGCRAAPSTATPDIPPASAPRPPIRATVDPVVDAEAAAAEAAAADATRAMVAAADAPEDDAEEDDDTCQAPPDPRDADPIRVVIRAALPELRACYERALARQPHLRGRLVLQFTIEREGEVTRAAIGKGSTLRDASMRRCVLAIAHAWQFPAPDTGGQVHVTYPFVFVP